MEELESLKLKTERLDNLGGIALQATAAAPSLQSPPARLCLSNPKENLNLYVIH